MRAYECYADPEGTVASAEDDDRPSQRVMGNPVTMEEMLFLPRPISPEMDEEVLTPQHFELECSPIKAKIFRNGGFPGSGHIAGENARLLMSGMY